MSKPRKPASPETLAARQHKKAVRVLGEMERERNIGKPELPKMSKRKQEGDKLPADKLQADFNRQKFEKARAKLFEFWKD